MSSQRNTDKKYPSYTLIRALRWSIFTPFYDTLLFLSMLGKCFTQKMVAYARFQLSEEVVMDIGCGTGTLLSVLKTTFPHMALIGIDPDPQVLNRARRRLEKQSLNVTLQQAYAERLPFSDASIDVCMSVLTFHHLPREIKREALQEIYRILKPGGRFILVDWGPPLIKGLRWLLLFEKQLYLDDHLNGLILSYITASGFDITFTKKVKMTGMYMWIAIKPRRNEDP